MRAAATPRSRATSAKATKASPTPITPKSRGVSSRARTSVLTRVKPRLTAKDVVAQPKERRARRATPEAPDVAEKRPSAWDCGTGATSGLGDRLALASAHGAPHVSQTPRVGADWRTRT